MKRSLPLIFSLLCVSVPAVAQYSGLNSGLNSGTPTTGLCQTTGCTFSGLLTVASQGMTSQSGVNLTVTSGGAASPMVFKVGPNGVGAIMLVLGGSAADIEPRTDIDLPGGTWGIGSLANNLAPIVQNTTFSGSTTNPQAAFGAFLQQTDNSSNTGNGSGLMESLVLNGSGVVGWRGAGVFDLLINSATGNTTAMDYTGLTGKCYIAATDAAAGSSCFGANFVSTVGAGVTTGGNVGVEIDTWEQTGAIVTDRVGEQIVDLQGAGGFGTQAIRDDVGLSLNNQYGPSSTLGFKIGLEFGRTGGNFPVSTGGTLIGAQGAFGSRFTVSNGIDWHLGTFTGNTWNDGHTILTGGGEIIAKIADPGVAPGAGAVKFTAEAGTNSGTCKIVVRAGTSSTATTLLDNIGGSC